MIFSERNILAVVGFFTIRIYWTYSLFSGGAGSSLVGLRGGTAEFWWGHSDLTRLSRSVTHVTVMDSGGHTVVLLQVQLKLNSLV